MLLISMLMVLLPGSDPTPLPSAHAHNDYWHPRPLLDALEHGFCSFEADIFLVQGKLLVGHDRSELKPSQTLQKLYLEPLQKRSQLYQGRIYPTGPATVYLLIDIKADGKACYLAVHNVLAKYAGILSSWQDGQWTQRAVTVVISGDCPRDVIRAQKERFAGIDGRVSDLNAKDPAHLMPFISASWRLQFRWAGFGEMPARERKKLQDIVRKAHQRGRKVRFWATPELPALWQELQAAEVDLINTDRLDQLRDFLRCR